MGTLLYIGISVVLVIVICVFEYCRRQKKKSRGRSNIVSLLGVEYENKGYISNDIYWKQQQENQNIKQVDQQQYDQFQQKFQPITNQITIEEKIQTKPIQEQIQTLNEEINNLDSNNNLTNYYQKQYQKHQYQQQLIAKLKASGEAKSIPSIAQSIPSITKKIEASNPDLAFYVLKESLLRDQKRELLKTNKDYSFGFDPILGAFGSDQSCFKVRNKKLDYDTIVQNNELLKRHLFEFKLKLSSLFKISIDEIQILGVSKGSFEINFTITGKNVDEIYQEIQGNQDAKKFLNEYCADKLEYVAYFDQASNYTKGTTLSSDDFNIKHNRNWDGFQEKEQRGPYNENGKYRYDYYFPIGCQGFGLNIGKYGENQDWLEMDGNPNEWRIMYHGTSQSKISEIVKYNLKPGIRQIYGSDMCQDEYGNTVKVGNGIYFSNQYTVCIKDKYAQYIQVGEQEFAPIFMSRVNPKKIRQSESMKRKNYFVVNDSKDVRPYRILIHEKQK